MEKVKIPTVATYGGHNTKATGLIDIRFKLNYNEIVNYYYKLPLLRSVDIAVLYKIAGNKPRKLGIFVFKRFYLDSDGEGIIILTSQHDFVDFNCLNEIVSNRKELIKLMLMADIETE